MNLIFRPLDMWTDPETQNRKPGQFSSSWSDTLQLLDREVDLLANGGKYDTDVVLQVAAPESAMRVDGGIRADAKVNHPGVIITFDGPTGPMRFATDRFDRGSKWKSGTGNVYFPAWQNNVRAIALGLEALRKIERYGIGQGNEQYTGYRSLGSGIEMPAAQMTAEEAAAFIQDACGGPTMVSRQGLILGPHAEAVREKAYRMASKKLHPDAGGSTADFQRLQEAKRVLDGLPS